MKPIQTPNGGRRPQLSHDARKMIEERLKKYDDPYDEEWDLGDPHVHRWEHHAISIFRDLLDAESQLKTEFARGYEQAREDAAKVAELIPVNHRDSRRHEGELVPDGVSTKTDIAATIRALTPTKSGDEATGKVT